jgi:hypothetical protein
VTLLFVLVYSTTDMPYMGIRQISPSRIVRSLQLNGYFPATISLSISPSTVYMPGLAVDNLGSLYVSVPPICPNGAHISAGVCSSGSYISNPAILRVSYSASGTGTSFSILAGGNPPAYSDGIGASASFLAPGYVVHLFVLSHP